MRISDWSSDVCSSDLDELGLTVGPASCGHEDAHRGTDILKNANMPAKCRRRRRRKVLRTHDFRPFAGDEFSECQVCLCEPRLVRSEEHTSELQSLMRSSYAVFCLKTKNTIK